jgi:AbiJ N-terminal domain 4
LSDTFSKRFQYSGGTPPITVREDAPEYFRAALLNVANDEGLSPSPLRAVICRVLRVLPDDSNWSEYPNIDGENHGLLRACDWFRVYDIAEAIYSVLASQRPKAPDFVQGAQARSFQQRINEELVESGIGWQMVGGHFQTRGDAAFESTIRSAVSSVEARGSPTAANEIREAIADMSRRPSPDCTGAIQHAMAALECLEREVVGDRKATLGELVNRHRDRLGIPKPLDVVVEKLWGYTCEVGRHLKEGKAPSREEAELVVTLVAALSIYLSRPSGQGAPLPFGLDRR